MTSIPETNSPAAHLPATDPPPLPVSPSPAARLAATYPPPMLVTPSLAACLPATHPPAIWSRNAQSTLKNGTAHGASEADCDKDKILPDLVL